MTRTASQLTAGDKTRDGSIVAAVAPDQATGWVQITWSTGYRVQVVGGHVFEMARKR